MLNNKYNGAKQGAIIGIGRIRVIWGTLIERSFTQNFCTHLIRMMDRGYFFMHPHRDREIMRSDTGPVIEEGKKKLRPSL
jgi:hypothetical protein